MQLHNATVALKALRRYPENMVLSRTKRGLLTLCIAEAQAAPRFYVFSR